MDLFSELPSSDTQQDMAIPLAEAIRPKSLDQVVGQSHLLGPGKVISSLIDSQSLPSIIFWGPPGTGKTTLSRLIADQANYHFSQFSAVTSGVADIKQVVNQAKTRKDIHHRPTAVFIDEIHRFNKAQQDALLPHVEAGTITLIGATTENPSFSVVSALLSRSRVFVLELLSELELQQILQRGLAHLNKITSSSIEQTIDQEAQDLLIRSSDGDARRLLTSLEIASQVARRQAGQSAITVEILEESWQRKMPRYDKTGDEHYNIISALHKSIRDSDPQGAVYWLGRMLEAGEDPMYVCRRLVRMAAEDIGLADPQALILASACQESTQRIGMPEANIIIAQTAIYLALAPKSNAVYRAYGQVQQIIAQQPNLPVPLHLRNAPTKLMKQLGHGQGYKYAHDYQDAKVDQDHLPDNIKNQRFYNPIRGWEKQTTQTNKSNTNQPNHGSK